MHRRLFLLIIAGLGLPAQAHDSRAGDLLIEHPYALPSATGSDSSAAYLRLLRNRGNLPDQLLGARASVATSVELQRQGQAVSSIALPANTDLALRHDGEFRLWLKGLSAPLTRGQRFTLVLRFERAGEREVTVWVQQPRAGTHEH